jgi:hypothetical protein
MTTNIMTTNIMTTNTMTTNTLVSNLLLLIPEDILIIIMGFLNYKLRDGIFMRQIELQDEQNLEFQLLFIRRPKLRKDHVILRYSAGNCVALFLPTMLLKAGRL